ncbi:recombination protein NinB [Undibacterium sp. MH2W]|uniref:recombination protein NinB n=1 Tax=Undibacterium sp. MH2W TaxID=3413044 RepID=UPI003BEF8DFF
MIKTFVLAHDIARSRAIEAVKAAPHGFAVQIKEPNRSLDQNAAQWPILQAFASQLLWPVNGQMVKMSDEEWKDVLSAAFKRESARIATGIDGGVVMLGKRTSKFTKKEFSEWLEFLHAIAADRGVVVYPDERAA